jgi:hypothetical protein
MFLTSSALHLLTGSGFEPVRSDCLDCQGVTQKTIKELLSNLKSQARKKRSKN